MTKQLPASEKAYRAAMRKYERDVAKSKAAFKKSIEKAKKTRDKELSRLIKNISGKGIYEPKGVELTRYRRSRLNKIANEFSELLDPKKFFFVKPTKVQRKRAIDRGKAMELKTTKLGIFVPKENYTAVKIKEDRKRGELYIERSGKTKRGENTGKRYRNIIPLADADSLTEETERLRKMADKFAITGKERISFVVKEGGYEGYGRQTFTHIDDLIAYLDRYKKSVAGKVNFYRHIEIVKTESAKNWNELHGWKTRKPIRKRGGFAYTQKFKRGR